MRISPLALVILGLATLLATGCVSNPIPKGYTGPRAKIADTMKPRGSGEVEIYMASAINGQRINNTSLATGQRNQGMGMTFAFTDVITREVPAQPLQVEIEGLNQYAADIQALFGGTQNVRGVVQLNAKPGGEYVVKGVLEKERQAVWIEDVRTGKMATTVVEKRR